jgi:ribokinase
MQVASVVVVGSVNMDLVFRSERLPAPGETLLGHGFATHPGGKGANQAVAIARLGGPVEFVGAVGADAFGRDLRAGLEGAGVGTRLLRTVEGQASGTAGILVDDAGMNSIVVAPGANGTVSADQVREACRGAEVVLAQLEIPLDAVGAIDVPKFILNPAPARDLPDSVLARCFALTPNETEAGILTGITPTDDASCLAAGNLLLDRGVQNVIVTLGARGCYWVSASGGRPFAPLAVQAVDTTAAGDAFNGALAWFVASGWELEKAILWANAVGALSTTKAGAQESMPDFGMVQTLVSEQAGFD